MLDDSVSDQDPDADALGEDVPHTIPLPPAKRAHRTVVELHKYRADIEELLIMGWTPTNLNRFLGRLHRDYEPVSRATLFRYKKDRLAQRVRPPHDYEQALEEGHSLIDTVRERAALIVLQKARVNKAVNKEKTFDSVMRGFREEIETLARLLVDYDTCLEKHGLLTRAGPVMIGGPNSTVNVQMGDVLAQQIDDLPPELRARVAEVIERIRDERLKKEVEEGEAEMRALLPSNGEQPS